MRREVLRKALSSVVQNLNESGVYEALIKQVEREDGPPNLERILNAHKMYSVGSSAYTEAELEICKIINIDMLMESSFWEMALKRDERGILYETMSSVRFALEQLPKVLQLISQDYVNEVESQDKNLPKELQNTSLLSVIIIEDHLRYSTPERLVFVLEAVSEFYSVCASLSDESENDLVVLACDSGSDKSFDFLGLASVMEQAKEIIINIWDRVVFYLSLIHI